MTGWIGKLFSLPGRGMATFAAMRRFDEKLGRPHRSFRSIHIAGTNGKGSTAAKIAAALQAEGYRVGLYTSPHISDVRERIRVDGERIPLCTAEAILERLFAEKTEELSFFDLLTALSFLYFKQAQVDWAVIETGIGGRLDATNVIEPKMAVITSIGYDHTHLLGNTLEAIAKEKEGIVKPGVPLVAGPKAAPFFPQAIAAEDRAFYDDENSAVARLALQQMGVSEMAIRKGIAVRPRCRFEVRGRFVFDAAHNPDAILRLVQALQLHFPGESFYFVVAFSKDKDWRTCLEILRSAPSRRITAVRGKYERLEAPENIAAYMEDVEIGTLSEALHGSEERVVVTGSFYILEESLEIQRNEGARERLIHR